jgi:hypothetical protein
MVLPRLAPRLRAIRSHRRLRGQALVETALLLPLLLILLLGAIDLGRAFFGWVNLHQAARIGANYAATHPQMSLRPTEQAEFADLINRDVAAINCAMGAAPAPTYTDPVGNPVNPPGLGDYAHLQLDCEFSLVNPMATLLFNGPITMRADAAFPVREGCVNCVGGTPAVPPSPAEQCRLVPNMINMSVAGARAAWHSAGFDVANFDDAGAADTATVVAAPVTQDEDTPCTGSYALFWSSVTITPRTPEPPTSETCVTVPNLIGLEVGEAEQIWEVDFEGEFTSDTTDPLRRVVSQITDPASEPGYTCAEPETTITVVTGPPWPEPPPPSCLVPRLGGKTRDAGEEEWVDAGFLRGNFSPANGGFTIQSQSLVGGSYAVCSASITVSAGNQGGGGGGGGPRP